MKPEITISNELADTTKGKWLNLTKPPEWMSGFELKMDGKVIMKKE